MKNKIYLLMLPIILVFTSLFLVSEMGSQGDIQSRFLHERVWRPARNISTKFTDWKFAIRGRRPPKSKVVIVEIDSPAVETIGRWPWHRDVMAFIVDTLYQLGAKVVGLDVVYSEPDVRLPDELKKELGQFIDNGKIDQLSQKVESDLVFADMVKRNSDKLVLGWTSESTCNPLILGQEECPVNHPEALAGHPKGYEKFALETALPAGFDPYQTPVMSLVNFIPNIPAFSDVATHSGYFNAWPDPDGVIRRTSIIVLANKRAYPSLPLAMAQVARGEKAKVALDSRNKVESITWEKSGKRLPVSKLGVLEFNFRGPAGAFPYVSVTDVISEGDEIKDPLNKKLTGKSKKEVFKDALVLIGPTALGIFDMRNFPFQEGAPGVDGHATLLDNLISDDYLVPGGGNSGWILVLAAMVIGGIAYALAMQKFGALPGLALTAFLFTGVALADTQSFSHGVNWETSFFYLEIGAIFIATNAIKYVLEERDKKFVRGAFAKYVAPAVVDSILKDPTKLSVGGEKRELTIMFSDIRSFTTFSERMDAKQLASFLNEYLGTMTEIVFANEGTLDKYIGDAIMAFWGAPLDQPMHAANACKAARAMMAALNQNKQRYFKDYNVDVNIGIGINTGVVSVGNMGSSNNFAYTVIGDHVNLSSRLEGLTKYYGVSILTTRFTFDSIQAAGGEIPPHRLLDHVKVKGKKTAVELIQVLERELPKDGLETFERARKLYEQQKWDEAIALFEKAGAILGAGNEKGDYPSKMYIQRCVDFKAAPPESGWDGSWEMHEK